MILALTPADAHAITMSIVLAFSLGILITMFALMARNGKRHKELDLPEFPEELTKPKAAQKPKKEASDPKPAAWERDPDWWK